MGPQVAAHRGASHELAEHTLAADDRDGFVHTAIDDHCRMAYAEICTDEKAETAVTVLQ